jgi:hypothetical protein
MSRARPTIRDLDGLPDLRDDATRRRSAIDLFVGKLHGAHLAFDKIGRPALTEEEARVALITLDALYRKVRNDWRDPDRPSRPRALP